MSNEPPIQGPPITITIDIVKKDISKMKLDKATCQSGIEVEMSRTTGDKGACVICNIAGIIICNGKISTEWEHSFIVCLSNDKGDALDRCNYRGLKKTKQAMKILERIVEYPKSGVYC